MQRVDVNAGSDDELRARTHGLRLGPDLVERMIQLRAEQAFADEADLARRVNDGVTSNCELALMKPPTEDMTSAVA